MRNILIHSIKEDRSTNIVLEWLFHFQKKITIERVNDNLLCTNISINVTNENFSVSTNFSESNYWYRRGKINMLENKINYFDCVQFINYCESDLTSYIYILESNLRNKTNINIPSDNKINKIKVYLICKEINLKFPKTWIGNNHLDNPFIKNKSYQYFLTKSLNQPNLIVEYNQKSIQAYSSSILIQIDNLNELLPQKFFPSLFQEYIEKKYEIRTFYLKGKFKSMAIFSQQNEKTKIDFRNYDYERPNRCVPYNLPKTLEKKLHKLMLKLDINCGSMDILVTPNNEYYFLEVNPIGQFHWLSRNCNYFIERMIAIDLSS